MTTLSVTKPFAVNRTAAARVHVPTLAGTLLGVSLVLAIVGIVVSSNATIIFAGLLAVASAITLAWSLVFAAEDKELAKN
ncbi:MAG: hypothetical protein LKI24_07565 [Acidipropionibacterium sp.]|nr:hypothetical protein [Acidipropionibacterium sp.]